MRTIPHLIHNSPIKISANISEQIDVSLLALPRWHRNGYSGLELIQPPADWIEFVGVLTSNWLIEEQEPLADAA